MKLEKSQLVVDDVIKHTRARTHTQTTPRAFGSTRDPTKHLLCFTQHRTWEKMTTKRHPQITYFAGQPRVSPFVKYFHTLDVQVCRLRHNLPSFLQHVKSRGQRLVDFYWLEWTCGHYVDSLCNPYHLLPPTDMESI